MNGDPPERSDEFEPDARNAMRAFLQRCEVRLSTMHRIANAFLSGAGLLVLIPVFSGDSATQLLTWVVSRPSGYSGIPLSVALLISFVIPLWSFYLLLRSLTQFYFVGSHPGSSRLFNPTFSLTGLAFPRDEGEKNMTKAKIIRAQYTDELIDPILPLSESADDFDVIAYGEGRGVQPATRQREELYRLGVKGVGEKDSGESRLFNRFNTALALAGLYDRTLHQEVANIEVVLVRHNLALRRIVISYVKSLLTMVSLFLTLFVTRSFLGVSDKAPKIHIAGLPADEVLVAVTLMSGALMASLIVVAPTRWIYAVPDPRAAHPVVRDPSLTAFHRMFRLLCSIVVLMSCLYLGVRLYELWIW